MVVRPLVGITSGNIPTKDWGEGKFQLDRDGQLRLYSEAVALAGGLPMIVPLVRSVMTEGEDGFSICGPGNLHANALVFMERLDGLVLAGGDEAPGAGATDMDKYRQTDRSRNIWEGALLGAALNLDKPVLAICRGLQLMNVALGGTLWADLPAERPGLVEHRQALPRARGTHTVQVAPNSRLAEILDFSEITVNSGHHRGLKSLAPDLKVSALATDGLIEAAEHGQARFIMGVQWHPEGLLSDLSSRQLFAAFVLAAGTKPA